MLVAFGKLLKLLQLVDIYSKKLSLCALLLFLVRFINY